MRNYQSGAAIRDSASDLSWRPVGTPEGHLEDLVLFLGQHLVPDAALVRRGILEVPEPLGVELAAPAIVR